MFKRPTAWLLVLLLGLAGLSGCGEQDQSSGSEEIKKLSPEEAQRKNDERVNARRKMIDDARQGGGGKLTPTPPSDATGN